MVAQDSQLLFCEAEVHPHHGKLLGSEALWEGSLKVTFCCSRRAKRKDGIGPEQNF